MRASMNDRFMDSSLATPPEAARSAFGFLGPLDAFEHELARLFGVAPADDLHPLAGLQILVVGEEVLDLMQR